jgi:hypothetical protein
MTMIFLKLELTLLIFLAVIFFTKVFVSNKYEDNTKLIDFMSVLIWIISIIVILVGIIMIISFIWTSTLLDIILGGLTLLFIGIVVGMFWCL